MNKKKDTADNTSDFQFEYTTYWCVPFCYHFTGKSYVDETRVGLTLLQN